MKVVDDWQIARYRIGELYDPHLDSAVFWYNLKTSGERDFRTWNVG